MPLASQILDAYDPRRALLDAMTGAPPSGEPAMDYATPPPGSAPEGPVPSPSGPILPETGPLAQGPFVPAGAPSQPNTAPMPPPVAPEAPAAPAASAGPPPIPPNIGPGAEKGPPSGLIVRGPGLPGSGPTQQLRGGGLGGLVGLGGAMGGGLGASRMAGLRRSYSNAGREALLSKLSQYQANRKKAPGVR